MASTALDPDTTGLADLLDAIELHAGVHPDDVLADPIFNLREGTCAHCGTGTAVADLVTGWDSDEQAAATCAGCVGR